MMSHPKRRMPTDSTLARRLRRAFGAMFVTTLMTASAMSQGLPFDVSSGDPASQRTQIIAFITEQTSLLVGEDRDAVAAARQRLLEPVANPSVTAPAFLDVYTIELSSRLAPALEQADVHARINAAIVMERLASLTLSPRFAAPAAKLLADDSPAVVVWGLKVVRPIFPVVLAEGNEQTTDALLEGIFNAVAGHSSSSEVVFEAYTAMTGQLLDKEFTDTVGVQAVQRATPKAIDAVQDLVSSRLAQYAEGLPIAPAADERAIRFLANSRVWTRGNKAQQALTVQIAADLAVAAAEKMASNPREVQDQLRTVLTMIGNSFQVIAQSTNLPQLDAAAAPLRTLSRAAVQTEVQRAAQTFADTARRLFPAESN